MSIVEISNLDRVQRLFLELPKKQEKVVDKNGLTFMKSVRKSAKLMAPRDTGELAESIRLKEAKYSDIPLPVGFRFVELKKESEKKSISKSNENADFICYQGNMPVEQVLDYYRANMERCGWRIDDLSCTQEGLLFCNKRSKSCVISVRDDLKKVGGTSIPKSHVYLFIKNKFQEEDKKIDINSKIVF